MSLRHFPSPGDPDWVDPDDQIRASLEVVRTQVEEATIQRRFEEFHRLNPRVYETLVRLARAGKNRGHTKLGIRTLWEVMRWEILMETVDPSQDEFKLNDHYHSRYVRLMMEQEEDLKGFFEVRRLRAE